MEGFGTYRLDGARLCYRPPVPPPPRLEAVWDPLERALRAVNAFDAALTAFPVANVAGKLFARLDAVHSSGAEGTTTTFSDLLGYQSSSHRARDPADAAIVAGYALAFDDLAGAGGGDPLEAALAIHRRLFAGADASAGQWKTLANGVFDADLGGFFHYTRPGDLVDSLAEWRAFTLAADGPELVRQALAHWMFEHIHPLADGNGRVGRLLVPLLLRWKGATRHACAFFGEAAHHDKAIYIDALKHARRSGDLGPWTRVFLAMVAGTAAGNRDRLDRLGALLADWRRRTARVRAHSVVHRLVPWVLTTPKFTVTDAMAASGQSFASVAVAVDRLGEAGIVGQADSGARHRLFAAPEVISLFEANFPPPLTDGAKPPPKG